MPWPGGRESAHGANHLDFESPLGHEYCVSSLGGWMNMLPLFKVPIKLSDQAPKSQNSLSPNQGKRLK